MKPIRVLVVDDSAFMRKVISDILSRDPDIEVIDRAKNGRECVEKVVKLAPDVVTLDIEMPEMNGLEALREIMTRHPVPVVMLSSLTQEGADATIRALEQGAIDFIPKPSGPISLDIHKVAEEIVARVKVAALSKGRLRMRSSRPVPAVFPPVETPPAAPPAGKREPFRPRDRLVAIGTSTGGPRALQVVLTALPATFSVPIVIVQHMPPGFTRSLAQRLDSLCAIRVVEAEDGQRIAPGTAYIAPGGFHLEVVRNPDGKLYTRLHQQEPRGGHRPSVDVLFESLGRLRDVGMWTVIMTGMGSDGTKGLKIMKETGQVTSIVEDESSCVVFGMPRAAIQAGLADVVVPLDQIADTLVRLVN